MAFSEGLEKVLRRLIKKEIKTLPKQIDPTLTSTVGESPSAGGGSEIRPGSASLSG